MKSVIELAQQRADRGELEGRVTHAVLVARIVTDEDTNEGGIAIFVDGNTLSPMEASLYLHMLQTGEQGIVGMVREQASSN